MKITKEQIPEWEELIRILSLYSICRVNLHKMKGRSKTQSLRVFQKENTPSESRFYLLQNYCYYYIIYVFFLLASGQPP